MYNFFVLNSKIPSLKFHYNTKFYKNRTVRYLKCKLFPWQHKNVNVSLFEIFWDPDEQSKIT